MLFINDLKMCTRGATLSLVFVFVFFLIQVDDQQLHLNAEDIENLDAAKLSRFIHVNNLHWVTEYSPMVNTGPCGQSYALVSGRVLAPGTEMFSRLLVPVSH
jgi:hypothetical protein